MRRVAVGLSLLILGASASPAGAQWGAPVSVPGAGNVPIELSFDPVGQGLLQWGNQYVSRSLDGGASWLTPALYPGGSDIEVGSDAAGNRVWAYATGSKIRMVRTGPDGGPAAAGYQEINVPSRNDLELAVSRAGDALVAWTTPDGGAGAAFWAAGAPAPGAPQTFASTESSSTTTPIPVLDPSRAATVVWTGASGGAKTFQAQAADAAQTGAFATPTQLAAASLGRGGQAPDGRAVIVMTQDTTIPANQYGQTTMRRYLVATRAPGSGFASPSVLAGSADRTPVGFATTLPVAPDGRAILGFGTTPNRPGGQIDCAAQLGEAHTEIATGVIGQTTFTPTVISGNGASGGIPWVAAGPDGRVAAIWQEAVGCAPPTGAYRAAFAPATGGLVGIPAPPFLPLALAFTGTGSLYNVGFPPTGPFKGVAYDTGLPIATPTATPTPVATATPVPVVQPAAPAAPAGPATPAAPAAPAFKKAAAVKNGSLKVTLTTASAGKLTLTAAAGKLAVAKASKTVNKAGTVTVVLKPTGKAAKTLRKKGKLKATLTIAFKPASGAAPAKVKRGVTFTRKR